MQDENGRLELIVSVEDNLGQLRLLAYTNLSNDDFTMFRSSVIMYIR